MQWCALEFFHGKRSKLNFPTGGTGKCPGRSQLNGETIKNGQWELCYGRICPEKSQHCVRVISDLSYPDVNLILNKFKCIYT